jgi:microcystin-dependent protein
MQRSTPAVCIIAAFLAGIVFVYSCSGGGGQTATSQSTQGLVPAGTILPFAGSSAPSGYLLCDGTPVSRAQYANLFAAIGTAWGDGTMQADGTTPSSFQAQDGFNLPDLRGRFLRGVDGTAGNDPDELTRAASNAGGNTGNAVGSKQADQFASHVHPNTINAAAFTGAYGYTVGTQPNNANNSVATINNAAAGGNETRPKNADVTYIVKL